MCSAHFPRLPLFDKLVIMSLCPALSLLISTGISDIIFSHFRSPVVPYNLIPIFIEKCVVTKIQICLIIGLYGISRKNKMKKAPLAKYQTSCANWRRRDINTYML